MEQKVLRITKEESEYEILYLLRDAALLYNRMNPENEYLPDIIRHIDEGIAIICKDWDLCENY